MTATAAALRAALPDVDPGAYASALAEVDHRAIRYPLGSGQAEEIALGAGLRPMIRQLLSSKDLSRAVERFRSLGLATGIAPRVYGATRGGWDVTPELLSHDAPGARRALFVSRDPARIEPAIAADLAKTDDGDRELGRLLGYPRCCVEAFVASSRQRKNVDVFRATLAATEGHPAARLNVLDPGVFHYVSWTPCSFRCALSLAYADAVAARIATRHGPFVAQVDEALAMHRLVLLDEVQLSVRGEFDGNSVLIRDVRPTACDRHPSSRLEPEDRAASAHALALVRRARRIRISGDELQLDDQPIALPEPPLFVPFGECSRACE